MLHSQWSSENGTWSTQANLSKSLVPLCIEMPALSILLGSSCADLFNTAQILWDRTHLRTRETTRRTDGIIDMRVNSPSYCCKIFSEILVKQKQLSSWPPLHLKTNMKASFVKQTRPHWTGNETLCVLTSLPAGGWLPWGLTLTTGCPPEAALTAPRLPSVS